MSGIQYEVLTGDDLISALRGGRTGDLLDDAAYAAADEIESLRSRLAEADALLREALPSVQSHIRKHRRSWEAAMKRGDEFHTRKHCEQMNKDLALEARIDAHLARKLP
jgi:ElaB/YqjD/DUF883 family membrane-anchored ribosome-binding protein